MTKSIWLTGGTLLALSSGQAVLAQQAPAATTAETQSGDEEAIVVTARLRSETLQNVPLAISAVNAKMIERQGIRDLTSLSAGTAGLQIDTNGGRQTTSPVVRGLSQVSRIDDENNTPVFIDGVYVSGRDGIDSSLLDVERIEVVKGPQSALYGRNSYAGSINFITRKPTDTLTGGAALTVGDHGRFTAKGSVSAPLVADTFYARLGAAYDIFDGTYRGDGNLRVGGYRSTFVSGGLRLVSGDFEAVANVYYADDLVGPSPQLIFAGTCQTIAGKLSSICGEYPTVKNPDLSGYDRRAKGADRQSMRSSLTLTQGVGDVKLTSLTGYNTFNIESIVDWERQLPGLPYNFRRTDGTTGVAQLTALLTGSDLDNYDVSQEFRVESATDAPFEWIVGGSYYGFRSHSDGRYAIDTTPLPAGATVTSIGGVVFRPALRNVGPVADLDDFTATFSTSIKRTKTFAGFGAAQYTFGESVTARGEVRYSSEEKALTQIVPAAGTTKNTFKYWTPRFTLDYKPGTDMLLYLSAARGAKSGGFNSAAPTPGELAFGPEFNWTYELGLKSSFLDRKLQLNLAVFDIEQTGIQITNPSVTTPATFITQNAGTGRSRGFEIEVLGRPTPELTLQAAYSLADAKFKNARDGSLRSYPSFATNFDVSGNPLPRQAKHLLNGYIQYETDLSTDITGYVRVDARYESKKNGFTAPLLGHVPGRSVVNARLGAIRGAVEGSLWVRNLFNNKSPTLASTSLTFNDLGRLPIAVLPEFRNVGATLAYKF